MLWEYFLMIFLLLEIEFIEEFFFLFFGELVLGIIVGSEICRNCKGKKNLRVVYENMLEIVF